VTHTRPSQELLKEEENNEEVLGTPGPEWALRGGGLYQEAKDRRVLLLLGEQACKSTTKVSRVGHRGTGVAPGNDTTVGPRTGSGWGEPNGILNQIWGHPKSLDESRPKTYEAL